jgi:hypothetical protein
MNTSNTSAPWVPYKIPPTPDAVPKKRFFLKAKKNSSSEKNPSQFLEWAEVVPDGTNKGDILYWNPEVGDEGAWVVLAAPSDSNLRVLTISGGNLAWNDTEDCE